MRKPPHGIRAEVLSHAIWDGAKEIVGATLTIPKGKMLTIGAALQVPFEVLGAFALVAVALGAWRWLCSRLVRRNVSREGSGWSVIRRNESETIAIHLPVIEAFTDDPAHSLFPQLIFTNTTQGDVKSPIIGKFVRRVNGKWGLVLFARYGNKFFRVPRSSVTPQPGERLAPGTWRVHVTVHRYGTSEKIEDQYEAMFLLHLNRNEFTVECCEPDDVKVPARELHV